MRKRLPAKRSRLKVARHGVEYAAARVALAFIDAAPAWSLALARRVAGCAYLLMPSRARTARDNILRSGIAATPAEASRLARESFRHLASVAVESVLCAGRITRDNWRDHVEAEVPEQTMKLLSTPGRGVIVITGHLGNWEVGGHFLSFIKPITAIARHMNNPWTGRLLENRSARGSMSIINKRGAKPRQFVQALRQGRMLCILMDQHTRKHGVSLPFFGRDAATHVSPARLHRLTRMPIVFQYVLRQGEFLYRWVASEPLDYPLTNDSAADIRHIMLDLTARLESGIRRAPEQYLWAHRRWRES